MRKRVKKQLREQEKKRFSEVLDRTHQLEVEVSHLQRALRISEKHEGKVSAMFEELQKEHSELETIKEGMETYIEELNSIIKKRETTIAYLKQPTWRKWWYRLKSGVAGKKGS